MNKKQCTKCKELKLLDNFSNDSTREGGKYSSCKSCRKAYNDSNIEKTKQWIKDNPRIVRNNHYKRFGITIEDYDKMLESQNFACAICSSKETKRKNAEHFAVDHCHKTGKVRGLLCGRRNVGIGSLEDSHELLIKAANYLKNKEEQ